MGGRSTTESGMAGIGRVQLEAERRIVGQSCHFSAVGRTVTFDQEPTSKAPGPTSR